LRELLHLVSSDAVTPHPGGQLQPDVLSSAGYAAARLHGRYAATRSARLMFCTMSNQLTFTGDYAGLERELFKGSAWVAQA
jgi:hypothetical protein